MTHGQRMAVLGTVFVSSALLLVLAGWSSVQLGKYIASRFEDKATIVVTKDLVMVKNEKFTFELHRVGGEVTFERLVDHRFGSCQPETRYLRPKATGGKDIVLVYDCDRTGKLDKHPTWSYLGTPNDLPDQQRDDFRYMEAKALGH